MNNCVFNLGVLSEDDVISWSLDLGDLLLWFIVLIVVDLKDFNGFIIGGCYVYIFIKGWKMCSVLEWINVFDFGVGYLVIVVVMYNGVGVLFVLWWGLGCVWFGCCG